MSEQAGQGDEGTPESHGVYGGTPREDGMQEEPSGSEGTNEADWADDTETGGDAT